MAYYINDLCIGCQACLPLCPSQAIMGEKKARHKINGDICIDCGTCGRICPAGSVDDDFGLTAHPIKKKNWERPFFDLDLCMSCNICLDTCPVNALEANLQRVGNRHPFPYLAREAACIGCGFCAADCPVDAIAMGPSQASQASKALPQAG